MPKSRQEPPEAPKDTKAAAKGDQSNRDRPAATQKSRNANDPHRQRDNHKDNHNDIDNDNEKTNDKNNTTTNNNRINTTSLQHGPAECA